jgi:RNA polymerase sigma-70 factor (ECF subfamily)
VAADPVIGRADAGGCAVASPGAQAAAQDLFERHGDRVLAYCRRRLRSQEEAEDALQTTFLYACRGLQRGVVPETEIAWLLTIAHNVCLSHWRADRRRRRFELVQDPERLEAVTLASGPSDRETAIALETALGDLTDLQRRAILLREWRGLSYREIATELKLSDSAVETLIFRARRTLAYSLDRQDVGRTRTRLARCLDVGGLLSALKSALGLGGSAKVAATLALGVAVLAGSIPDVSKRADPAPPKPATVVEAPRTAPEPPVVVGPVTSPGTRAAARLERADSAPKESQPGESLPRMPAVLPPLEVGETVGGVTDTATDIVEDVTETVVPGLVPPVTGVLGPGGGLPLP